LASENKQFTKSYLPILRIRSIKQNRKISTLEVYWVMVGGSRGFEWSDNVISWDDWYAGYKIEDFEY
jgi:hypothetical protein